MRGEVPGEVAKDVLFVCLYLYVSRGIIARIENDSGVSVCTITVGVVFVCHTLVKRSHSHTTHIDNITKRNTLAPSWSICLVVRCDVSITLMSTMLRSDDTSNRTSNRSRSYATHVIDGRLTGFQSLEGLQNITYICLSCINILHILTRSMDCLHARSAHNSISTFLRGTYTYGNGRCSQCHNIYICYIATHPRWTTHGGTLVPIILVFVVNIPFLDGNDDKVRMRMRTPTQVCYTTRE